MKTKKYLSKIFSLFFISSIAISTSAILVSCSNNNQVNSNEQPKPNKPSGGGSSGGGSSSGGGGGVINPPVEQPIPNPDKPIPPTTDGNNGSGNETPPNNSDNKPINSNFIINKLDIQPNYDYYINNIKKTYAEFLNIRNKHQFDLDKDSLAIKWAILIHDIMNLHYLKNDQTLADTINFKELKLTIDELNYLMIIIQSKYSDWWFNFNLIENISYSFEGNILNKVIFNFTNLQYNSLVYKKQLSTFIYNGLSRIKSSMNDLDKLTALSLYVCEFLNYSKNEDTNITLVEALNTRIGVCRHYVILLMMLLDAVGIENYASYGNSFSNGTIVGYHVWNMVKINNKWLVVDLTSSDYYKDQFTELNSSGPSMKFDKYFLMPKLNQNSYQTYNSTFQKQPFFDQQGSSNDINAYINSNASFLYRDYWSDEGINCIYKNNDYKYYGQFTYYNNCWYSIKNKSKGFEIVEFNNKDNSSKIVFNKNVGNVNLNLTLNVRNLMLFVATNNNQSKLCAFDLNQIQSPERNFIVINDVNSTNIPLVNINNKIYQGNIELCDLNTKDYFNKNDEQMDANTETNMINKIANVFKYATIIGNNQAQIPLENVNQLAQKVSSLQNLKTFIDNLINFKFLKDFNINNILLSSPSEIRLNKNEFINNIQPKVGYLKIVNLLELKSLWFNNIESNLLKYEWSFNSIKQPNQNSSYYHFDSINEQNFKSILGTYECTITNLWTNEQIKKQFQIVETNELNSQNSLYPYWININQFHNSLDNETLSIRISDLINIYNDIVFDIQIKKDGQEILKQSLKNTEFNYQKNKTELVNQDYGLYEVNYLINNQIIFSFKYYMFSFK